MLKKIQGLKLGNPQCDPNKVIPNYAQRNGIGVENHVSMTSQTKPIKEVKHPKWGQKGVKVL